MESLTNDVKKQVRSPRSPNAEACSRWRKAHPEAHRAQQAAYYQRKRQAFEEKRRTEALEIERLRLADIERQNAELRAKHAKPMTVEQRKAWDADLATFNALMGERSPVEAQLVPASVAKPEPRVEVVLDEIDGGMLVERYVLEVG